MLLTSAAAGMCTAQAQLAQYSFLGAWCLRPAGPAASTALAVRWILTAAACPHRAEGNKACTTCLQLTSGVLQRSATLCIMSASLTCHLWSPILHAGDQEVPEASALSGVGQHHLLLVLSFTCMTKTMHRSLGEGCSCPKGGQIALRVDSVTALLYKQS